jgi:hypothetical protein
MKSARLGGATGSTCSGTTMTPRSRGIIITELHWSLAKAS